MKISKILIAIIIATSMLSACTNKQATNTTCMSAQQLEKTLNKENTLLVERGDHNFNIYLDVPPPPTETNKPAAFTLKTDEKNQANLYSVLVNNGPGNVELNISEKNCTYTLTNRDIKNKKPANSPSSVTGVTIEMPH